MRIDSYDYQKIKAGIFKILFFPLSKTFIMHKTQTNLISVKFRNITSGNASKNQSEWKHFSYTGMIFTSEILRQLKRIEVWMYGI